MVFDQDPFTNQIVMPNVNPEFENFMGVVFDRRITNEAEAIRMELIQKELDKKKVKIEMGSNEIYKGGRKKKRGGLESENNRKRGIFKAGNEEKDKGKVLTVKDYREMFR